MKEVGTGDFISKGSPHKRKQASPSSPERPTSTDESHTACGDFGEDISTIIEHYRTSPWILSQGRGAPSMQYNEYVLHGKRECLLEAQCTESMGRLNDEWSRETLGERQRAPVDG